MACPELAKADASYPWYIRLTTRQPIELGDDQGGFVNPAGRQGFGELRSIATTAALNLRELADGLYAVEMGLDGLPLRLKPRARCGLGGPC